MADSTTNTNSIYIIIYFKSLNNQIKRQRLSEWIIYLAKWSAKQHSHSAKIAYPFLKNKTRTNKHTHTKHLNMQLLLVPANSLLGINFRQIKIYVHTKKPV